MLASGPSAGKRQEEGCGEREPSADAASPRWAQILRQHVLPWLESVGGLAIGFTGVSVEHGEYDFRFQVRKPA